MSFLLDTCVVSLLRQPVPESVEKWFVSKDDDLFYISVVTVAEIEDGIARLSSSRKKRELQEWFYGDFQDNFSDRCLPIDEPVAHAWGQLNAKLTAKGKTIGVQDLYIAATAMVHGLAVVTHNDKDFLSTDIAVVNPWKND